MDKSNTIVTASNLNYLWGVFLLIASLRRTKMYEPVIVFADGYDERAKKILRQFGNVDIVDAPFSKRSMTCRKPEAMLLAKTEYVTWADCDAFFLDNCSEKLIPPSPEQIHIRKRSADETLRTRLFQFDENGKMIVAKFMSDVWKKDVGELESPRLDRCCSACFLSISLKWRDFLIRWKEQMEKVLPDNDFGVVNRDNPAYFQTDESVLNSLLCYMRDTPEITADYALNKNPSFAHFIGTPKPWKAWTTSSMRFYEKYMEVVDYALENKMELPSKLPFSLTRGNRFICKALTPMIAARTKFQNASKKLKFLLKRQCQK